MRKLFQQVLNPDIHLRRRLFQLLSLIALAEFVIVTLYTAVIGGGALHLAIMLAGMVLFAVTVSLTFRTGKMRLGSTVSGLLYFSLYPLTFFSAGGIFGGAPTVLTFALVYVFLVTQKWERVASLALCVVVSGTCFFVAYLHPELLNVPSAELEYLESFLSVLLAALLICMLFAFVTEVYLEENRIVQRQKKEIEELSQVQKRFFSSMSHEIRTPVNAIIGLSESTLREPVSNEVRENMQGIEAASRTLLHTVNEIMDMSKLETGTMEILHADYRTASMLADVVGMVWLQAQEKGLKFEVEVAPDLPTVLNGDEVRIKQVLLNVITNAVKYTKAGSVTFRVNGRRDASGVFTMQYDVIDTGIGIRQEDIPRLFTAFGRVDAQETHAIEGTGLGLSIVKQLLDMMGGNVSVTSEYGKGSAFHVEIPQTIVDATPIGEVELQKAQKPTTSQGGDSLTVPGVRILAVDDTPMNLMVVKKLLRDTQAVVETASSGAEALQKTLEAQYDLILMDHQMPEMDGVECLHRIREQEGGLCRDCKIVCLTANAGEDRERHYLQEGFDGYLVKPVRGKTLEDEIIRLIPRN